MGYLEKVSKLVGKRIEIRGEREHSKASEKYIDVVFTYPGGRKWEGSVPIHYRRTGTFADSPEEMAQVINEAYEAMQPLKESVWTREQDKVWGSRNAEVTQGFFDVLKECTWKCVRCQLPTNPNWARRVQDIKEQGYTMATDTRRFCPTCERNTTQLIMLRLPRVRRTLSYETWSQELRNKILRVLRHFDAYENRPSGASLLPDHKFPEIRWDEGVREENSDHMTEEKIGQKFQLLTNQRNQQKREVCRNCFQTGKRGTPFGISFFYQGSSSWPGDVPKRGKRAEKGCIGCGWYDLAAWRRALNEAGKKMEHHKK